MWELDPGIIHFRCTTAKGIPFIAPFPSWSFRSRARILENGVLDKVSLWFPGAALDYVENLPMINRTGGVIAISATGERGVVTSCTSSGLCEMVWVMAVAWKVGGWVAGWQPFTLVNVLCKMWVIRSNHNQLSMLCHHCSGDSEHRRYIFKYCDGHGNFCKASKRA